MSVNQKVEENAFERGAREFIARQMEAKAAVVAFAEGWVRTLKAMADNVAERSGCSCEPGCAADANESSHTAIDCPVLLYLRLSRLMQHEADKERHRRIR